MGSEINLAHGADGEVARASVGHLLVKGVVDAPPPVKPVQDENLSAPRPLGAGLQRRLESRRPLRRVAASADNASSRDSRNPEALWPRLAAQVRRSPASRWT